MKIIPLKGIGIVKEGDDLSTLIVEAAKVNGVKIEDGDVIVIAHKIVSKAEGRIIDLKTIIPSKFALKASKLLNKDPRMVEVILRESKRIVRMIKGHIICETKHGFVCANAGIDKSNVEGEDFIVLLPKNPDASAEAIRKGIKNLVNVDVAVIISDTFGRPWRSGQVNVAIGVSGLIPLKDYRGRKDMFNFTLKVTIICVADELASAAELVMNKTNGVPVALIKGYKYVKGNGSLKDLVKQNKYNLFP
ncbi:coenzyme F420-0:L-glutamate ligase [Candidatus Bathyarchaeota archaeon]|nr:coenzyme F420-0:L-glutamate ligase [Candidatus Bathyarchaeota archaeon]